MSALGDMVKELRTAANDEERDKVWDRCIPCGRNASRCVAPPGEAWQGACPASETDFCPRKIEADEQVARIACERRTAEAELRRRQNAPVELGIPERIVPYLDIGVGTPLPLERTVALDAVKDVKPGFLILAGPTGTGKSTAAGVWAWEWRRISMFRRVGQIVRLNVYDEDEAREYEEVSHCGALVIDDVGVERKDDAGIWAARFDDIISARYDRGERAATVITSNLLPADLERHVGPRVWDRFQDLGRIVVCTGRNMRRTT